MFHRHYDSPNHHNHRHYRTYSSSSDSSTKPPPPLDKEAVRDLFQLWNDALKTKDAATVASRYSKHGNLLPTLSDRQRLDFDGIRDYFETFLQKQPTGHILSGDVLIGRDGSWAQDAGIYEFTFGSTGETARGRYTFVYVWEDGAWKISHHHSSLMPEATTTSPTIMAEHDVRSLFHLWNDALLTLDADQVARRYAKRGAVLLPTVSDVPRTDYEAIKDYFVAFLAHQPAGDIVESYVTIGHDWCADMGIYEFTMKATGEKFKGRYSFVYVWEDGEWMIGHHHSSKMPEGA